MSKLDIVKGASEILVSIGVGSLVGNAIKMTADPNAGRIKKIATGFGGYILASMVSDRASDYASERIDNLANLAKRIFQPETPIFDPEEATDAFGRMFPGSVVVESTQLDVLFPDPNEKIQNSSDYGKVDPPAKSRSNFVPTENPEGTTE